MTKTYSQRKALYLKTLCICARAAVLLRSPSVAGLKHKWEYFCRVLGKYCSAISELREMQCSGTLLYLSTRMFQIISVLWNSFRHTAHSKYDMYYFPLTCKGYKHHLDNFNQGHFIAMKQSSFSNSFLSEWYYKLYCCIVWEKHSMITTKWKLRAPFVQPKAPCENWRFGVVFVRPVLWVKLGHQLSCDGCTGELQHHPWFECYSFCVAKTYLPSKHSSQYFNQTSMRRRIDFTISGTRLSSKISFAVIQPLIHLLVHMT